MAVRKHNADDSSGPHGSLPPHIRTPRWGLAQGQRRGKRRHSARADRKTQRWVDFWTGQIVPRARRITTPAKLDSIPVWVRAPSIVVLSDPGDHAGRQTWDALTLRVYAGDMRTSWETEFDLYEDDRETYAYEHGAARRTRLIAARVTSSAFELRAVPTGRGAPMSPVRRGWRIEVVGVPTRPAARFARRDLAFTQDGATQFTHLPAMRFVARESLWMRSAFDMLKG